MGRLSRLWNRMAESEDFISRALCRVKSNAMKSAPSTKACLAALFAGSLLFAACQSPSAPQAQTPREIHTPAYDLLLPAEQKALLILFPCFPCDAADTRSESPITDQSTATYL